MSYSQFTYKERESLQYFFHKKITISKIAEKLKKHPSSITREIKRNRLYKDVYIAFIAHGKSIRRRAYHKPCPKRGNKKLMQIIEKLIKKYWSPEQISGRLKLEHKNNKYYHISHETIYSYIYQQIRNGNDLRPYMRKKHKYRKRKHKYDDRGKIFGRVFIDKRPKIVDSKKRFGDWEADTIIGGKHKGYIGTFVERKSKYLKAFLLPQKLSLTFVEEAKKSFRNIPNKLIKTITTDSGTEFTLHDKLSKNLNAKVYFCHPYHPWERGLVENTNGLLRQFFPKKSRLDNISTKKLDKIIEIINNRPRKILKYRTPDEVLLKKIFALQI